MPINSQKSQFKRYATELKELRGVFATYERDSEKEAWTYSSSSPNSLGVTVYHWTKGADFVGIEIPGVDCAYWHTAEEEDLDYHIELAKAALRGDIAYNRSPIMRYKEVCFKVNGAWECTRIDNTAIFHYLTTRKHLKKDKDYRKTKL
jgi:hypothetical protein